LGGIAADKLLMPDIGAATREKVRMSMNGSERLPGAHTEGGAIAAATCIRTHPLGRKAGIEEAAQMSLDTMYHSLTGGKQFTEEMQTYLLHLPAEDRLIAEAVYARHGAAAASSNDQQRAA
jgi:hypothetical protein